MLSLRPVLQEGRAGKGPGNGPSCSLSGGNNWSDSSYSGFSIFEKVSWDKASCVECSRYIPIQVKVSSASDIQGGRIAL